MRCHGPDLSVVEQGIPSVFVLSLLFGSSKIVRKTNKDKGSTTTTVGSLNVIEPTYMSTRPYTYQQVLVTLRPCQFFPVVISD